MLFARGQGLSRAVKTAAITSTPLLLGAAYALGFAPFRLWAVSLAATAAFVTLLLRRSGVIHGLAAGLLFGLGVFTPSLSFLFSGLDYSIPHASIWPLTVIVGLASLFAVFGAVLSASRLPATVTLLCLAPVLWLALEWLRHQGPLAFPWLALGYSQIDGSPLAGYAPVFGVLGVSFFSVLCAGAIALLPHRGKRRYAVCLIAGIFTVGWVLRESSWVDASEPSITVSALQGNVPTHEKFPYEYLHRSLDRYLSLAKQSTAKLIVMPESALPLLESDLPGGFRDQLAHIANSNGGDLVYGALGADASGTAYHSSAFSVGVSGRQRYDKVHLLPFAEFVPLPALLRPHYERVARVPLLDTVPGAANQGALTLAGTRVAIRMCFEDAFGNEQRAAIAESAMVLSMVNDDWHGHPLPVEQHLQVAQARALEAGRPIIRVSNTGWTAAIGPDGRIKDALTPHSADSLTATVQPTTGLTPYMRFGDGLIGLVAALILVANLSIVRNRPIARLTAAPSHA